MEWRTGIRDQAGLALWENGDREASITPFEGDRPSPRKLQSSGCTISTTVATLILRPISSQLPDGTGTLDLTLSGTLVDETSVKPAAPSVRELPANSSRHLLFS